MDKTATDAFATATFDLAGRIDKLLIGNDLEVVELALAVVVAKLALARKGDSREKLGAFFERVDGILCQWEEEHPEDQTLKNMPTIGTIQ